MITRVGPGRALVYGAVGVGAVLVGVWALSRVKVGDVDPVGAGVGTASLLAGLVAMVLAVRAWRWQETNTADLTQRLADMVTHAEGLARQQLLGGHDKPINVEFELQQAPAHNATHAATRGQLQEVVAYYTRLRPRRMVITGAPGAGKTVLAIELILALLDPKTRKPDDPVPVRFSAASWDITADQAADPHAAAEAVERWLVEHLTVTYRLAPASAAALVAAQKILPVIDGLDEMDAVPAPGYDSRAARALQILNGYQVRRAKAELVLTCRRQQYQALLSSGVWAEDAACVQIHQVTIRQTRTFLHDRVNDLTRWQNVLNQIDRHPDSPLAQALSTPWRLTLAVVVYEQRDHHGGFLRDPSDLTAPALDTPDAIRDHLLASFIPAATAVYRDPDTAHRPDPDRTHRWLAVLAAYLDHNASTGRTLAGRPLSSTDIVLHELWPLAGTRLPRAVHLGMIAAIWLIAAPVIFTQAPIGLAPRQILGTSAPTLGVGGLAYQVWTTAWSQPSRADLTRLRTPQGLKQLAFGLAGGLMLGLAGGLAGGLAFGLAFGLALGLALGLTGGLALGLAGGLTVSAPNKASRDPRTIPRDDLAVGLTLGLSAALAVGLAVGLTGGLTIGLAAALAFELAFGLTGGLTGGLGGGLAGWRYVALLLCTRRRGEKWLPWRLGRFLDWCYHAGLIRIAGNGYQFRHRELQDYLAHHPVP
ncbi:MAG TPA: NACHT domain-containing protein [Kineosporiaceae bacterium]|nr:NACHT domain-containing protein [Kineosporiaceae bacterium]